VAKPFKEGLDIDNKERRGTRIGGKGTSATQECEKSLSKESGPIGFRFLGERRVRPRRDFEGGPYTPPFGGYRLIGKGCLRAGGVRAIPEGKRNGGRCGKERGRKFGEFFL